MNTFLMSINYQQSPKVQANHITLQGFIQYGDVSIGDIVDVKHLSGESKQAKVIHLKTQDNITTVTLKTDDISFTNDVFFITSAGSSSYSKFIARLKLLTPEEGGRKKPLLFIKQSPYEVILFVHQQTFLISPYPTLIHQVNYVELQIGETHDWFIDTIERYIPLEIGSIIELREGKQSIARGAVKELITKD